MAYSQGPIVQAVSVKWASLAFIIQERVAAPTNNEGEAGIMFSAEFDLQINSKRVTTQNMPIFGGQVAFVEYAVPNVAKLITENEIMKAGTKPIYGLTIVLRASGRAASRRGFDGNFTIATYRKLADRDKDDGELDSISRTFAELSDLSLVIPINLTLDLTSGKLTII